MVARPVGLEHGVCAKMSLRAGPQLATARALGFPTKQTAFYLLAEFNVWVAKDIFKMWPSGAEAISTAPGDTTFADVNDLAVAQMEDEARGETAYVLECVLTLIAAKVTSQHAWGPKRLCGLLGSNPREAHDLVSDGLRDWKSIRAIERYRDFAQEAYLGSRPIRKFTLARALWLSSLESNLATSSTLNG